jgi:hypothetical protein
MALVLGEHHDPAKAGVHKIRQSEIDEPVLAPKGDRWFGPIPGQRKETPTFTAGENHGECMSC